MNFNSCLFSQNDYDRYKLMIVVAWETHCFQISKGEMQYKILIFQFDFEHKRRPSLNDSVPGLMAVEGDKKPSS